MWKSLKGLTKGWLPQFYSYGHATTKPGVVPILTGYLNDKETNQECNSAATRRCSDVDINFLQAPPNHIDGQWQEKINFRQKCRRPGHQFQNDFFDFLGFGFFIAAGLRLSNSGYLNNDERKKEKNGDAWNALASTLLGMAIVKPGIRLHRMVLPVGSSLSPGNSVGDRKSVKTSHDLQSSSSSSNTQYPLFDKHVNRLKDLARRYTAIALNSDALRLIEENEYKKAVEYLLEASELGLDKAMFNLGICHELGRGVKQDLSKACQYYRNAAELGHTNAAHNLAVFNLEGRGIPINKVEGLKWMEKASNGGVKEAQTFLGIHFGQIGDYKKAVSFFKQAVEQKHSDAEYYLGVCYENGLGLKIDFQRAALLLKKSAQAGNPEACYSLATYYENGLGGIACDPTGAIELYYKAATLGHPLALKKLGWRIRKDTANDVTDVPLPVPKSESLRAVSSLPDLGHLRNKKNNEDTLVPNNKNSCSMIDFKNLKEPLIDYCKFNRKRIGRDDHKVDDFGLSPVVSERDLLTTNTLLV